MLEENLRVIGFEPNKEEYIRLEKSNPDKIIFNTALWNDKQNINFYVTRADRLCSCLEPNKELLSEFPNSERFDVLKKIELPANTLDDILQGTNEVDKVLKRPDFVKIDTQGTELFILEGMKDTLSKSIFGIEVEVEFIEMYRDQPLFNELDGYLRSKGFYLFDLKKFYWKRTLRPDVCACNI